MRTHKRKRPAGAEAASGIDVFHAGDLVERRIDNEYYYKQTNTNPEYGIVLETKTKDYGLTNGTPTFFLKVLWVGNKFNSSWHVTSSRLRKVDE